MTIVRWASLGGLALVAAALVGARSARARWDATTADLTASLAADAAGRGAHTVSFAALQALPPPVRRYFATALQDGQGVIRIARLESTGTFRQVAPGERRGPDEGWMPFTAVQTFTPDPPGFVWSARMRMLPLIDVEVRDSYVRGRGTMQASALGAVPVVDAGGTPQLASGALLRFLAEAPWLPTALLPGPRLVWIGIDETRARATLRDGATEVSAVFEFADAGEIVRVSAEREMSVGSGYVRAPWQGRFWQHETRAGMRIPIQAEVSWMLDGDWRPYWRGRITAAAYETIEGKDEGGGMKEEG